MTKTLMVANTDWYLFNFKLSLARVLRESGFEVVMVSPPGEYVARLEEMGFRHIAWNVERQTIAPWKELGSIAKLRRIYSAEKPDLVQHFTIKPVLYGAIASKLTGVRRQLNSITGRGYTLLADEPKAKVIRPIVRFLYRLAFSGRGVMVIFENEEDRRYFVDGGFLRPEMTRLIEGVGVDTDHFTPAPEPDGIPVVGYVGRLLWDKGVGELIDAARLVYAGTPIKVLLAGEPDEGNPSSIHPEVVQSWVAEGFVEWIGFEKDVKAVYHRCHVLALPSYGEGVPTVLLEAAACGRAIIASDIPGCRVVVDNGINGILVPVGDVKALADGLQTLITDKELRLRMGAAGRERAVSLFTKQRINRETLAVICEMLTE